MKKFVCILLIIIGIIIIISSQYSIINTNYDLIEHKIENIGGVLVEIESTTKRDYVIYQVKFIDKDNKLKNVIFIYDGSKLAFYYAEPEYLTGI